MDDRTFQFALLGATLIGTAVAIIVGKILDKTEKNQRVIAIDFDTSSQVIDLSQRNIMLSPKGTHNPIARVYERELLISNVGFGIVEDLEVVWNTNYVDEFSPDSWVDFDLRSEPPGIRHEFEDLKKTNLETTILIKFRFLNRGDNFRIRTTSSSEFSFNVSAHHLGTEIRFQTGQRLLPTFRDKVGRIVSEKQIIQLLAGALAAAGAAVTSGILG